MNKYIVEFTLTDGYTYSCTETRPFEYASAEQLAVDLEELANDYVAKLIHIESPEVQAQKSREGAELRKRKNLTAEDYRAFLEKYEVPVPVLSANGFHLQIDLFIDSHNPTSTPTYDAPKIYTVNEWFDIYKDNI